MALRPLLKHATPSGFALILAVCLLVPAGAMAQVPQAAKERIRLLNSQAMEQYDVLEFDKAKELLEKALSEADTYSLSEDKSMALTYINLGVVYGAGFNDRLNAVKHFSTALKLESSAAIDAMRATPTLEEMFTSAKESVPPPKKKDLVLRHTPLDDVRAGRVVTIKAMTGVDLKPAKVLLIHWGSGQKERSKVEMRQVRPNVYQGQIPSKAVSGRSIYYYIEAQNEEGRRIQGHGTKGSPNIISIRRKKGTSRSTPEAPKKDQFLSIYVMVGAGFGVVHGGESENTHPLPPGNDEPYDNLSIETGGAIAPFHIAPEIDYHINTKWHIGLMGRIQFVNAISQDDQDDLYKKDGKPTGKEAMASRISLLGVLRAKRFFLDGPLKLYVAFGVGGGQLRHRIELGNYDQQPNGSDPTLNKNDRVDTRLSQYVAFNVGGGLKYMFHRNIGFALDLSGLILVPNFAAHLDVNLGPVVSF